MDSFPDAIQRAMRAADSAATCVPVQLGGSGDWEAAFFIHVSGPECRQDRRSLKSARTPVPADMAPRLMAHSAAAVVSIEISVRTVPDDPLNLEILLIPGRQDTHYQAIKLLASQRRICWFFGDNDFRVIQAQELELEPEQHEQFETIARDAFAHDFLLRSTHQYDSDKALAEIASHYSPRTEAPREATH